MPTPTLHVLPAPEAPPGGPLTRALRAVLVEHRLPGPVGRTKDRLLRSIGLPTKIVRTGGMQVRVRRLTVDESFVANVLEGREYDPPGYEIRPSDVVLDIGANIGSFALKAARTAKAVYAVEPSAANYALLEDNVRRNAPGRVLTLRGAVADHAGTVELHRSYEGGFDSIMEGRIEGGPGVETVPAYTLERLFEHFQTGRLDVLKLDCEGAEYPALYSLPDQLWGRIGRIVMEYHGIGKDTSKDRPRAVELATLIERRGFRIDCFEEFGEGFRGGHIRAMNPGLSGAAMS